LASFLPTSYRGLSELGEIAGVGMIIAFISSITLLPALLAVFRPGPEPRPIGFSGLAPLDRFLLRHRIAIVAITAAVVVLAAPSLMFLRFDFDPNHLRNPAVESVATYLELRRDPRTGANAANVVEPTLAKANAAAERLAKLPQVGEAKTLSSLVPADQDQKLKLIHQAAKTIDASLNPGELESPPSDGDVVDSLKATAGELDKAAANKSGPGADAAKRLSQRLSQLASADQPARGRAEAAFVAPLRVSLDHLRSLLKAQRITEKSIPSDLARQWVTPDGRAKVELLAKGDPDDTETLRNFVSAVLAADPTATGPAVMLFEAGNTVVRSFFQAGTFALFAIALLLLIVLRRISDVLLTLVPLLVAGVVTLELCVALGIELNFANIIALPLLLGVGVAFKIYYIEAWRAGQINLLQSYLTRAVIFSALATATAFGSLWLSDHPGTSGMGKLMALSLVCTMAAAVLFQPMLMGPPRTIKKDEP
jgi:hopanoid biosynthesis associated RND transporter like protein HpnN